VSTAFADGGLTEPVHAAGCSRSAAQRQLLPRAADHRRTTRRQFTVFVERAKRVVDPCSCLVALVVGGIVVMMYMPVFDIASSIAETDRTTTYPNAKIAALPSIRPPPSPSPARAVCSTLLLRASSLNATDGPNSCGCMRVSSPSGSHPGPARVHSLPRARREPWLRALRLQVRRASLGLAHPWNDEIVRRAVLRWALFLNCGIASTLLGNGWGKAGRRS